MSSLQQRLQEPVVTASNETEALFLRWQELKSVERQCENELKAIRADIEEKISNGELVGFPDAYLTFQDRETVSCDMDSLVADLGEKIALRCADVSAGKLRKMIDAGVVPADAPYIKRSVTKSLVTKTNKH